MANNTTYVERNKLMAPTEADFKRFHEIEEEGRGRASEEPPYTNSNMKTNGDTDFFEQIRHASSQIKSYFLEMNEGEWANLASRVSNLGYEAYYGFNGCKSEQLKRDECPASKFENEISGVDEAAKKVPRAERLGLKGGCTISPKFLGNKYPSKYHERHMLNDVTSCFHHTLTHAELTARSWHHEGKCSWRE